MSDHMSPLPLVHERTPVSTLGDPAVPLDPTTVSPDFVVQIRDISGSTPCLTDDLRATIQGAIADSFAVSFPGVFVDSTCAGGPDPANEAAAFGAWLQTPDNPPDELKQARRAALDSDIGRAANETIAFYINATLFTALAEQAAANAASGGGSIHLDTPFEVDFRAPDTIVTVIRGVDDEPTPDLSFTLTIKDRFLGGPRPAPAWYVEDQSLDKDAGWINFLAFALSIPLAFTPLFAPISALAWYQSYEVAEASGPATQGVGSGVASQLLPPNIPVAGGLKLPIEYSIRENHNGGIEVDDTGMYVGGFILAAVPREPSVVLSGATHVSVHIGGGDYPDQITAHTSDLRGTLTYRWTVNGRTLGEDGSAITLFFNPSIGPFGAQDIAVTVTDEDGLTASATMRVTVTVTQPHHPGGSGNPVHPA
jgi:hypothetical protein